MSVQPYPHRTPGLSDRFFFYGADALSSALQDYVKKELEKSRQVDFWGAIFSIGGIFAAETVKSDINRELSVPLRSLRYSEPGAKAKGRAR